MLLGLPDSATIFRNVSLWINVSGIVQGTTLADWLLAQRCDRYSSACSLVARLSVSCPAAASPEQQA